MRATTRLLVLLLLVGVATAGLCKLAKAPDFKLTGIDGKPVSLHAYAGKVVIVDFWATWCGPCREEIPSFIDLQKKYGKQGLQIVGLSVDREGPGVVKDFAKQNKINYPVALATEAVVKAYGGIESIPTTFLINRKGEIVKRYVGLQDRGVFVRDIMPLLKEKAPKQK